MEAQSQRLACVATTLPGIGELIERRPHRRAGAARRSGGAGRGARRADPRSGAARPARRRRRGAGAARIRHGGRHCRAGARCSGCRSRNPRLPARRWPRQPIADADRVLCAAEAGRSSDPRRATGAIAQLFLDALRLAGHQPFVASRLRSYDGAGDRAAPGAAAQRSRGGDRRAAAAPLATGNPEPRPSCGSPITSTTRRRTGSVPRSARRSASPMSSPRRPPRRSGPTGRWQIGHRAVEEALRRADAVIGLNPADRDGVLPLLARAAALDRAAAVSRRAALSAARRAPGRRRRRPG